jgi:hypothetical protein
VELPSPATLSDSDLLRHIVGHGGRLLLLVQRQHDKTFSPVAEDPRWPFALRLSFELQHRYLMAVALDAFDVAVGTLGKRASQQALGAIRFLAEAVATAMWLCEPTNTPHRQYRAFRLMYRTARRTEGLARNMPMDDPRSNDALALAIQMKEKVEEIARQDGMATLRESPDRPSLFNTYLPQFGHRYFMLLSEFGSHPGALGVLLFAVDHESRVVYFQYTGAVRQRAFWISAACQLFVALSHVLGRARGWEQWLDNEFAALAKEAAPFLEEAGKRGAPDAGPTEEGSGSDLNE